VTKSPFNKNIIFLFTVTLLIVCGKSLVYTDETLYCQPIENNDKIHILSDKLVFDNKTGIAEFSGNVKITQGATIITSDSLEIFYDKNKKNKQPEPKTKSIKKLIVSGNVKITMDNMIAITRQAEYIIKNKVLILTGAGSKIISGNNSVSGSRIILYRTESRVVVEGGSKSRVEAVFTPENKVIN
jgi:lipopolysaccharide transport protein LptA